MKGHPGRVITAVVLLPIFYVVVRYLPSYCFFLLVTGGILIGQYEFYRFHYPQDHLTRIVTGMALGFLLVLSFYLGFSPPTQTFPVAILTLIAISAMLFSLFTVREIKGALIDSAVLFFGVFYVSFLLSHLLLLRGLQEGEFLILFIFGITWLGDAGAYYVGSLMGRHSLAPRISPKKTIEGAVGGLVLSVMGSLAAKFWFLPTLTVADSLRLGLLLGVVGQLGDLVESLWKRSAGVKDSSSLFAAHGGLLDKVDSLIFTAPVFYYYLILVKG
ncbi:MAG TPA: phosphatidate cytidylyltransferase [Nitrospiria bacterium]|nr:phosphatidate cytidylyltransferase [Nitrospiria bacterium]